MRPGFAGHASEPAFAASCGRAARHGLIECGDVRQYGIASYRDNRLYEQQRPGKLAHVAVDTSLSIIGSGRNWPPPGLPVKPLPGARIGHGQANIVFGLTGAGRARLALAFVRRG
jgi:hypothetical protein